MILHLKEDRLYVWYRYSGVYNRELSEMVCRWLLWCATDNSGVWMAYLCLIHLYHIPVRWLLAQSMWSSIHSNDWQCNHWCVQQISSSETVVVYLNWQQLVWPLVWPLFAHLLTILYIIVKRNNRRLSSILVKSRLIFAKGIQFVCLQLRLE